MANGATISRGVKLEIKDGSTYKQVKGFKSINGMGSGSAAVQDASDFDSEAKEKLIGLSDEGQVKISVNYVETDPGQLLLQDRRTSGDVAELRVTKKNGTTYTIKGYVLMTDFGFTQDVIETMETTVEVTGKIVRAAGTPA